MSKKRITILGMGDSRNDFLVARLVKEPAEVLANSEVWAINYIATVMRCDKMIAMDMLDHDHEGVIDWPGDGMQWLKDSQLPIISSKKIEGLNIEEYPLEEVTKFFGGFRYFNTSVAYAIALAMYQGAEEIMLFGCDFTYKDVHHAEAGRACAEFWLGVAIAKGIQITIGASSSLLDQNTNRVLYGYAPNKE